MVWDIREIITVCNGQELAFLNEVIGRVSKLREEAGKRVTTRFVVVSEDEPYFRTIADMIDMIKGRDEK